MSETLRLELKPFGVVVLTAMLGHIESNFHVNDSWQGLPASSNYKSVEEQIAKSAQGKTGSKAEDLEDFARGLISDVLRGRSGQVWRGNRAQTVRFIGYHAPSSIIVCDVLKQRKQMSRVHADQINRTACSFLEVGWMPWQRTPQGSSRVQLVTY